MKKILIALMLMVISGISVLAQKGFVRGKVTDGETGEGLYGATVVKQGTTVGVIADFDGNYSLQLDPGIHNIVITFISYQTQTIENVEVKAGQVTKLDFVLKSEVSQLEEVVVTGEAMRDTESGIMTYQRKSANVLDGVSNQTFRKTGDRDLATAMKRVTGVSVQNGKFVYVRALGDRYTRTTINGMTIPGLDPDRNDVQIDIFPTNVLENVIVYKSFTPNLPADFTGGIVDVEMKNFPEEKTTSVSLGFSFNPNMNLKRDFLTYNGGNIDWLGFDDGTRKLPFPASTQIPDESRNDPKLETLTRSLNPDMGATRKTSFLNSSFAFNHGNQINKGKFTIGYTAILNYQNRFEYYPDSEFGDYTKNDDKSETALFKEEVRKGELSRNNVLWTGLLSGAIKFDNHTFSASLFRTQNGLAETSDRISTNFDQTQSILFQNILTYSQRSVTNGLLSGTHQFGKLRFDWKNSYTVARTYDPDFRSTSITITEPESPTINPGQGAGVTRFWRDLNETNENLKLDFTFPYGKNNKLQFGAMGVYKDRNFEVLKYFIDATTRSGVPVDPNYFLRDENIWTPTTQTGTFLKGNKEAANNYQGKSTVLAGYLMTEMNLLEKFKAIYGVRVEAANMYYTGTDIFGTKFNNDKTLKELNVLPSINLVYALNDRMNIRASYGETLARPSFKEKSAAQIFDPITDRYYNGNLDLEQTSISNYDLRLESFFNGQDMISVSGFYKKFDGHIELVTYDIAVDNVKPRNAGTSLVYGVEFELKKKLGFISPTLENVSFGTNVSLAKSEVELNEVYVNDSEPRTTEFESRQMNAREGEIVKSTRPMGGQSPYLINGFLNYADRKGSMNVNLSYNVQGESLSIIGVGAVPDVYTQPFHSLNLNIFRTFGLKDKHRVAVGVNNILDAEIRDLYKGYGDAKAIYSIYRPGRTFSLTYGISL